MSGLSAVEALALWRRPELDALAAEIVAGELHLTFPSLANVATRRGLGKYELAEAVYAAIQTAEEHAVYEFDD